MEYPPADDVVEDVIKSLGTNATDEAIEERIADMGRLTDVELARFDVLPAESPVAMSVKVHHPSEPLEFQPVEVRPRHGGWTAERQRIFIAALAETGCVSEACAEVGINPRSAYRLREHPKAAAFRDAWDHATSMASARLAALAFDRAVNGTVERIYRGGELVEERHKPNDRLLMWLMAHLDPAGFGWLSRAPKDYVDFSFYKLQDARKRMPKLVNKFKDMDQGECAADPLFASDYDPYGDTQKV